MDNIGYRRIKSLMALMGISVTDIAKSAGVGRGAVSMVITGRSVSANVQRILANRLGMPIKDLFPDYKPSRRRRAIA